MAVLYHILHMPTEYDAVEVGDLASAGGSTCRFQAVDEGKAMASEGASKRGAHGTSIDAVQLLSVPFGCCL